MGLCVFVKGGSILANVGMGLCVFGRGGGGFICHQFFVVMYFGLSPQQTVMSF